MAKRISAEEREQITALFPSGLSCRQIAAQFSRSTTSISHIARSFGHEFGQVNTVRAREVKKSYDAERRANIRLSTAEIVEQTIREFTAETLVYNFGGKDNDYNEHTLEKPDARTKRDLAQTIATLWRVVKDIDAAEATVNDTSGLEDIFRQLAQVADEHGDTRDVQPETGAGN